MNADSTLHLAEVPVFDALGRVSVAFACELTPNGAAADPACGFRLAEIYRELFGPAAQRRTTELAGAALERARKLFAPSRSFLDDITTGLPGVNGRPLLLSAELDERGRGGIAATIVRPEAWEYESESTRVRLAVDPGAREIPVLFHDHFCIFESGRLFYLAIFGQAPGSRPQMDEYAIIQMERLAIDSHAATNRDFLGFRFGSDSETLSLRTFLERRLADLSDATRRDPNALRDVIRPFGILAKGESLRLASEDWLRNGLVQIEDETMFGAAAFAAAGKAADSAQVKAMKCGEKKWRARHLRTSSGGPRPHHAASFEPGSDTAISRRVLAFAGLAQGVPDFPRQDESEVHDSTRPASAALESLFFVHPAFELALGTNWRTFGDAQENVGGCPYAIMAWIIGLHDEVIVTDMERRIERLIYGIPKAGASARELGRTEPAGDLVGIMETVARFFRPRRALIDDNLQARLDIFRWCSIHRSGNVFRYATERELLGAIREARGTGARFDDAHATLDRYESLVEDLSSLSVNYSAARTNWLLAAITVFSLFGLPKEIEELSDIIGVDIDPLWPTLAVLAVALALFAIFNRPPPPQLNRSRKSS